eukprot:5192842-Amphidinium_carterae.1
MALYAAQKFTCALNSKAPSRKNKTKERRSKALDNTLPRTQQLRQIEVIRRTSPARTGCSIFALCARFPLQLSSALLWWGVIFT